MGNRWMPFAPCVAPLLAAFVVSTARTEEREAPLTYKEMPLRENEIAEHPVFSPDSKTLAVLARHWVVEEKDFKHEIVLFDVGRGVESRRIVLPPKVYFTRAFYSPDGRSFATFGFGHSVFLWDLREGKILRELEDSTRVREIVFSPDGKRMVARVMRPESAWRQFDNYLLVVWDTSTGERIQTIETKSQEEIRAFTLAADGEHVLLEHDYWIGKCDPRGHVSQAHRVQVHAWNLRSGRELGAVGDATEYSGVFDEYGSAGATLHRIGAAGDGYCARDINGRELHWTPWKGRLTLSQRGRVILFPDYRPPNPVRFGGYLDALLNPVTHEPLHELGAFYKGHQHGGALAPDGQKAAVGQYSINETYRLYVWDVSALARKVRPRPEPIAGREATLWDNLGREDRHVAHSAMRALVADPARGVPLLRERLRPIPPNATEVKRVAQLLADLDSEDFPVREAAGAELEHLGELARPALEKALGGTRSLEVKRWVRRLLDHLAQPVPAEELRLLRGVDILEQMGSDEAQRVLRSLAAGLDTSSVTLAARQALARLSAPAQVGQR